MPLKAESLRVILGNVMPTLSFLVYVLFLMSPLDVPLLEDGNAELLPCHIVPEMPSLKFHK